MGKEKLSGTATEKQKEYMKILGIKFRKNISKQAASDLIQKEKQLKATARQISHDQFVEMYEEASGETYFDPNSGFCPNGMF